MPIPTTFEEKKIPNNTQKYCIYIKYQSEQ
jgi:hypothetical protein